MNKLIRVLPIFLLASSFSWAQPNISSLSKEGQVTPNFNVPQTKAVGDSCGAYANQYLWSKITGLGYSYLGYDNVNWFSWAGQYFDCPQPLEISGISFSAFAQGVPSIDVIVQLYSANPDSTANALLGSDTVNVTLDSYNSSGLITDYYEATFDPVVVNQPYLLVIKNDTYDTLSVYSSSTGNNDGQGEELSIFYYNNPAFPGAEDWYHYPASTLDFDIAMAPIIKYETTVAPEFLTNDTLCTGQQFCVDYKQQPIFRHHMYSKRAGADSLNQIQIQWGDGLEINDLSLACHVYNDTGNFAVTIRDTIERYENPTVYNFCPVLIDTFMYVQSEPVIYFSSDSDGSSLDINFTDSSFYGDSYSWDFGDGATSTTMNPSHTYTANGVYNVKLTLTNDCGTTVDSLELDLSTVGINDWMSNNFKVYPNPTTGQVNIEIQNAEAKNVSIVNTLGQNIATYAINGATKRTVSTENWSAGMYFIQIKDQTGATMHTKKLIVR